MSASAKAEWRAGVDVTTPADRETRMDRTFDAPRERVWRTHTDPELVAQW